MKGSYYLRLKNRHISYSINIERNITIIKGDSGTGKTSLLDMLDAYNSLGKSSGVSIQTNMQNFYVLDSKVDYRYILETHKDTVFFADEHVEYVLSKDFYNLLCSTGSYLVYITRSSKTGYLQYSVNSIKEFKVKGINNLATNSLVSFYKKRYVLLRQI